MRLTQLHSLEYSAPESLPVPTTGQLLQVDSKADMWSLGMILHKLLFFRLPYLHTSDNDDPSRPRDGREYTDKLEAEIAGYPGFRSSSVLANLFESRRLPKNYLLLLETLLNVKPSSRPSSERVLGVIKEGGVGTIIVNNLCTSTADACYCSLNPSEHAWTPQHLPLLSLVRPRLTTMFGLVLRDPTRR